MRTKKVCKVADHHPTVTTDRGMNYLTVLINGTPHVRFCVATIIGFQTYFWNSKRGPFAKPVADEPTFSIELYFTDHDKITLQYDSRELWAQIIQAINQNL